MSYQLTLSYSIFPDDLIFPFLKQSAAAKVYFSTGPTLRAEACGLFLLFSSQHNMACAGNMRRRKQDIIPQ